ncbi:MAG: isoprenoid biosynthesis glyoxalase ElbB [Spirosomataceae bacterium]
MKKIGVLLHGCGVFDGTEIQEAVLTMLAIKEAGADYICLAPNVTQHHVLNHITGEEMPETRSVLIESARIARGEILDIENVNLAELDGIAMPGGFGTAKNITTWAFEGPHGAINPTVQQFLVGAIKMKIPIAALCMSPTTLAKALEGSGFAATLTVGSTAEASPYDIAGIAEGIASIGHHHQMATINEIAIDSALKIVTAPCYMMEASIMDVRNNIKQAIDALLEL